MISDPSNEEVTARILFTGVMLSCINKSGEYEVGIVRCPKHEVEVRVTELPQGGQAALSTLNWPAGHDLIFRVVNPVKSGIDKHTVPGAFDFNLVVDLEGQKLHNNQLTVDTSSFQRRLAVTDGLLYTHELTPQDFDLASWQQDSDPGTVVKNFGKLADTVGLNINCRDGKGSGIAIIDTVTGETIRFLPKTVNISYLIEVDNDCDPDRLAPPPIEVGTDFRFYYKTVSDQSGVKYDFIEIVPPKASPPPSPGACVKGTLSKTDSLGLAIPHP